MYPDKPQNIIDGSFGFYAASDKYKLSHVVLLTIPTRLLS